MKFLKPYVVIGVSGANWQLKFVHKHFFKKFPFIYFPYDIISHFFGSYKEALKTTRDFEINAERYCFENAEGIIHKGDPNELKYINNRIHNNLKITKHQLNFLPYCSREFVVSINKDKLSKKDKSFHMVYVGGCPSNSRLTDSFKKILKQGIHIHAYVIFRHLSEKNEKNYIYQVFDEIINDKLFHIHKPLNPKEIITEISKYDFGFFTSNPVDKENIESLFATGNKLSSYLEAGIPFICNEELVFLNSLMKKYGLSIPFEQKSLKKRLQKVDWKKIEKNIIFAREELSMEKNFPRLENFIKKIVKDFEEY